MNQIKSTYPVYSFMFLNCLCGVDSGCKSLKLKMKWFIELIKLV